MSKSTTKKPKKPRPDFPLTPRHDGRWCKTVRGVKHVFSGTAQEALAEWLRVKDDLLAGRKPPPKLGDYLSIENLCNLFLESKEKKLEAGYIVTRTFNDYRDTCNLMAKVWGKQRAVLDLRSSDFDDFVKECSSRWGPVRVGNEINRARVVLNYASKAGLIKERINYGDDFKRPSPKVLRLERKKKGMRFFAAVDINMMLDNAGRQLKAMILLGINCGLGNSDIGQMKERHVDLKRGWLDYPRPKTGIDRTCPLWPETVEALQVVLARRFKPKSAEHADLVFITRYGLPWHNDKRPDSPVTKETRKLLDELKIYRPGLSFYGLRHTFQTIGVQARDKAAVDHIMGHAPMSHDVGMSHYNEFVAAENLRRVTDYVRTWLFPDVKVTKGKTIHELS